MNKLAVFDLDGTLYQTEITTILAVEHALTELGLPTKDREKIKSLIGEPMDVFCKELASNPTEEEIKQIMSTIIRYEQKYISEKGRLFTGVKNLLKSLTSKGYTLAICSNGRMEYITTVLKTTGVFESFTYIRGREEGKTKGEVLAEMMKEVNPDLAFMVGDRIHDIDAAKENNIPCIGAIYGYGQEELNAHTFNVAKSEEILNYAYLFEIFENMVKDIKDKKKRIVGFNGVDTSGKTVMATHFYHYLYSKGFKSQLIHIDDFHNKREVRYQGIDPIQSYLDYAFNLELLESEILKPLKDGQLVDKELSLLDLGNDTFTNRKCYKIDKESIVIIEGVLLYRPPIESYVDYKVFIDISFDEVIRRAIQRDVPKYGEAFIEKYKEKYIPLQKRYIEEYKPKKKSDILIDNENYLRPKIKK